MLLGCKLLLFWNVFCTVFWQIYLLSFELRNLDDEGTSTSFLVAKPPRNEPFMYWVSAFHTLIAISLFIISFAVFCRQNCEVYFSAIFTNWSFCHRAYENEFVRNTRYDFFINIDEKNGSFCFSVLRLHRYDILFVKQSFSFGSK